MNNSNSFWFWVGVAACFIIVCMLLYINSNNHKWESFSASRRISIINDIDGLNNTKDMNIIIMHVKIDKKFLTVTQRKEKDGFKPFGQWIFYNKLLIAGDLPSSFYLKNQTLSLMAKYATPPIGFIHLWDSRKMDKKERYGKNQWVDFSIWRVVAPEGYSALCDVFVRGIEEPSIDSIVCLPNHLLEPASYKSEIFSYSSGTNDYITCKEVGNNGYFYCSTYNMPQMDNILQLKEDTIIHSGEYSLKNTEINRVTLTN